MSILTDETTPTGARQVPLTEQLLSVPKDARLFVEDGPFSTRHYPIGKMCHEAAAVMAKLQAQEPVAWQWRRKGEAWITFDCKVVATTDDSEARPLYAVPVPAVGQVPPGYVLAPFEPTEQMVTAGWIDKEDVTPAEVYSAMLAAAPEAPKGGTA